MRKNSAENTNEIPKIIDNTVARPLIAAKGVANCAPSNNVPKDSSSIDMSSLGANALELSSRVSRAFALVPSPFFEIPISGEAEVNQSEINTENSNRVPVAKHQQRSSSLPAAKIGTSPIPLPPRDSEEATTRENSEVKVISISGNQALGRLSSSRKRTSTDPPQSTENTDDYKNGTKRNHLRENGIRSSGLFGIENGLDELADLAATNDSGRPTTFIDAYNGPRRTPMMSPTLPQEYFDSPSVHHSSPPLSPEKIEEDSVQSVVPDHGFKDGLQVYEGRLENGNLPSYISSGAHNLNDQAPSKIIPRSESPMLAPKPISPARQLKLKNSVPQLMKSLPKVPDSSTRGLTVPGTSTPLEVNIPCRFSELLPEGKFEPIEECEVVLSSIKKSDTHPCLEGKTVKKSSEQVRSVPTLAKEQEVEPIIEHHGSRLSPMKLKLKVRNPVVEKASFLELQDQKQNEKASWSGLQDNDIPLVIQEEQNEDTKPVKLKLRLTRATGSEPSGTIRVYNDSADQFINDLNIPRQKDLFTPNTGLDNIFRQVSRHLHSRKPSANSDQHLGDDAIEMMPSQIPASMYLSPPSLDSSVPASGGLPSPTDARSFFSDDSSHRNGSHGLRKRISNFRARVGVPYAARNGSYSCDDIVWRDQSGAIGQSPLAAKSVANLNATRASFIESPNPRRAEHKLHAHRFRAKVSEWFRGARAAISARVKPRSSTSTGNERSRASE